MASTAEKLAANMDLGVIARATELKQRLLFVMGALIIARVGSFIPIPGIDPFILKEIFEQQSGGVLGMFNVFSGGALGRMTIFALTIMPYISASIILQLMTVASPHLAALKKEGEAGKRKINQYTRYGTVVLALFQGFGIAVGLESMTGSSGASAVIDPGFFFRFTATITLVGGTMFLVWLGEQITARGIGNGISLIITVGIIAEFPAAFAGMFEMGRRGVVSTETLILLLVGLVALFAFIVFMERAQRRVVIQHPKRQMGNRLYQGENTHLPIKLNMSGVIPPIFASSILLFPLTIAGFNSGGESAEWLTLVTSYLQHGSPVYVAVYAAIIIFFAFFYTAVVFNVEDTAENLKKNGAYIPGIRPGPQTAKYLDYVTTRITVVGAIYLAFVCALPEVVISKYSLPLFLGGTSLLITVNVILDFVGQIQSHLFAHQYEGLLKQAKLRGKGGKRR
jgi:preprotein translocase subunit SecY